MLDTVLYARDKYLRPETGILLPDKARICYHYNNVIPVTKSILLMWVSFRLCCTCVPSKTGSTVGTRYVCAGFTTTTEYQCICRIVGTLLNLPYMNHRAQCNINTLYFCCQIDFWDSVYGFDMKVIKNIALTEPLVDVVEARAVLSNARPILSLDISTCSREVSQCKLLWGFDGKQSLTVRLGLFAVLDVVGRT